MQSHRYAFSPFYVLLLCLKKSTHSRKRLKLYQQMTSISKQSLFFPILRAASSVIRTMSESKYLTVIFWLQKKNIGVKKDTIKQCLVRIIFFDYGTDNRR